MQCANCGFQNMPGSDACGRCRTSLRLSTAVMDVRPPRARPLAKRFRRLLPARQTYFRTRDALRVDQAAARARAAAQAVPNLWFFLRLIVPGWSHWAMGLRIRGHLFFWSYVACMAAMLWCFGSTWGSIWLGLAFSVHSSAALDIINRVFVDAGVRERIIRSVMISFVFWVVLYWPAVRLIGAVAEPHTIQMALPPFQTGDVVLVNRLHQPARGDVVLYLVDSVQILNAIEHRRYVQFTGMNIDRILAVPGDRVACEGGRLLVNDAPSPWQPLNTLTLPKKLSLTLAADRYLILPSGAPGLTGLEDPDLWHRVGNVTRSSILGHAFLQSGPISNIHFIR